MYKHLTQEQRYYICCSMSNKVSVTKISKALKIHVSTVYRELKRNRMEHGQYHYKAAQGLSEVRRYKANCSVRFSQFTPKVIEYLTAKLKDHWSPEQIAGRLLKKHKIKISYKTIYKYIWQDKEVGGKLYKLLPHQGKRYKYGNAKKTTIPNRVDISQRPKIVERKQRIGDFEADTIVSKRNGSKNCLVTLVDRKSKFTFMRKVQDKCANSIQEAIEDIYINTTIPILTITPDNGTEFANHQQIAANIACSFYFARPYRSCDRGLNEHTNGKIRAWLPKKTDFADVDNDTIAAIQDSLNNRPRKSLGFLTPNEVINKHLKRKSKLKTNFALHR